MRDRQSWRLLLMAKGSSSRTLAFALIICGGIVQFVSIVAMIVQSVLYPLGSFLAGTALFRIFCCFHGRFGSAGQRPPRVSMAMAMKASGVWNPLARLVSARRCVFVASESALDRP